VDTLTQANQLTDPDHLEVGQVLTIPVTTPEAPGSDFKIIPDSELVYSPSAAAFDVAAFLATQKGYINQVQDTIEGDNLSAVDVINWVAEDYSVNPRLLLAVVEYQGGWVTQANPSSQDYPVAQLTNKAGLYKQLAWVADNLNRGYYLWRANAIADWVLLDGSVIPIAPTLNAGTAGVQYMFSLIMDKAHWEQAISPQGVLATYANFFGSPFDYALDPLLPADLSQPTMQLPFEPGVIWSFTGGPHGGWDEGSGWAALDFGPPGDLYGCFSSDAWDVAVAPGMIVRSEKGRVVEVLNGTSMKDGGWTVLYMHVEDRQRVAVGTHVQAGDHIGHPSCEGGVADATHLHLVRRYNGEWIPADGSLPFNLDGWVSSGSGQEYDGYLKRNGETLEAFNGREPQNQIQR
jgi:murein DD-endopeptidase MepM/ murein hydrolase activator NlpD